MTAQQPAIKQNTRQRLEYIETLAFYSGVVSRSELAHAFGLSGPAATKILKQYNDLAPGNLVYQQAVFGFVPTSEFSAHFADLSPATALPLIASESPARSRVQGNHSLYGIPCVSLPLPGRLPAADLVSQITRGIRWQRQVEVVYHSLTRRDRVEPRIIEPHALVNTGLRWHVRAYNTSSFDFRDFVLSRLASARMLDDTADSGPDYDEAWTDIIELQLAPHPKLGGLQQQSLMMDYGMTDGVVIMNIRRALIGYALRQLSVDTSPDYRHDPETYPLIVTNRDEVEPYAAWAFETGT